MPLVKINGKQFESSWEEAIEKASQGLQKVVQKWGPDSVGFIGSTHCSNEDNYLLMRLARDVVKTGNIDTNNRLTYFPILDAFHECLGTGSSTATLKQVAEADFILVAGADLSGTCPQGASRILEALNRKAELAVVDPRATKLAKLATYHLKVYPSTDLYWINGMISHLIDEGKVGADFIGAKTAGYNQMRKELAGSSLSLAESMSGISAELLKLVSEHLVEAEKAVIVIGSGLTDTQDIKRVARGLINLALVTGHVGKEGSGILMVGGNNNTQGAWDMGAVPDRLAGAMSTNKSTQETYGDRKSGSLIGKDYLGILNGVVSGEVRALYVMGEDLLTFTHFRNGLQEALVNLELLVVQDLFPTELTKLASVVFPASAPYESSGTYANLERRVQRFDPILEPWRDTKADWEILSAVSQSMGADFRFKNVSEVTDDIASLISSYRGITSANLNKAIEGITWPPKEDGHPGEPWLQDGWKGKFSTALPEEGDRLETSEEYPLLLIPGRLSSFWDTGTRSSRINFLAREEIRSAIHLNPEDAKSSGVKGGWRVRVISPLGRLETAVVITEELPKGLAYLPIHKIDGDLQQLSKRSVPVRVEAF